MRHVDGLLAPLAKQTGVRIDRPGGRKARTELSDAFESAFVPGIMSLSEPEATTARNTNGNHPHRFNELSPSTRAQPILLLQR
jgi:hypothetical protein